MSENISVSLFGDYDHLIYVAIILPEILDLVLLALGIGGLYNGTEIGHPVYSLLFANLIFPWFVTVANISAIFFLPLQNWLRLAPSLNYLCLMFHSTTWCVISGLRYCYIIRTDWLDEHWPNPKKLRMTALGTVFLILAAQLSTNSICFLTLATPYGWPSQSFFSYVPLKIQSVIILVCLFVFLFPIGLSIFVYLLLLKHRGAFELKNKIGIEVSHIGGQNELFDPNSKVNYNLFNVHYDEDQSHLSIVESPTFQRQTQLEPESELHTKQQLGMEMRKLSLNELNQLDITIFDERLTKSMSDLTKCTQTTRTNYFERIIKLNKGFHDSSKEKNPENNLTSVQELIKKEEIQWTDDPDRAHFIAEKMAAIRSLQTNLTLIAVFFFVQIFLIFPPKEWQIIFSSVYTSISKSLLPLLTSLANFGNVRNVLKQYRKICFKNSIDA